LQSKSAKQTCFCCSKGKPFEPWEFSKDNGHTKDSKTQTKARSNDDKWNKKFKIRGVHHRKYEGCCTKHHIKIP